MIYNLIGSECEILNIKEDKTKVILCFCEHEIINKIEFDAIFIKHNKKIKKHFEFNRKNDFPILPTTILITLQKFYDCI